MITFGLAQARTKKIEKYSIPVLTMGKFNGDGSSRKFYFNKAAIEQLGLTDTSSVCFARDNDTLAIINCSELSTDIVPEKIRRGIKKTDMSISTRDDFDQIAKHFDLSTDIEHEFTIDGISTLTGDETPAGVLSLIIEVTLEKLSSTPTNAEDYVDGVYQGDPDESNIDYSESTI